MFRAEDKYVIPKGDFLELYERVRAVLPPDSLAGPDGGYTISSLYFDDIEDTDYFDTVSGNPIRYKYRARIYNNTLNTVKLEVKEKNYSRIRKTSCLISEHELHELMRGNTIELQPGGPMPAWKPDGKAIGNSGEGFRENSPWDPRVLFDERILGRLLRPRVIITYERHAFVYEAGNTRITFDRNIRASDNTDRFGSPDIVYDHPCDGDYVLEVKYDEFIPDFILQILETDSMQKTSYSKYAACREIYGERDYLR